MQRNKCKPDIQPCQYAFPKFHAKLPCLSLPMEPFVVLDFLIKVASYLLQLMAFALRFSQLDACIYYILTGFGCFHYSRI